jgi:hypothetical protein
MKYLLSPLGRTTNAIQKKTNPEETLFCPACYISSDYQSFFLKQLHSMRRHTSMVSLTIIGTPLAAMSPNPSHVLANFFFASASAFLFCFFGGRAFVAVFVCVN